MEDLALKYQQVSMDFVLSSLRFYILAAAGEMLSLFFTEKALLTPSVVLQISS